MKEGDLLEVENQAGEVKQIGPIIRIEDRPDKDRRYAPEKKQVIVAAPWDSTKLVRVPLQKVHAVIRTKVRVIEFQPNEQQDTGCAGCGQRRRDYTVPGNVFCSLHCMQDWISRYYSDYPPGQNPIDKGERIEWANCGECRKLNRPYCPNCVD